MKQLTKLNFQFRVYVPVCEDVEHNSKFEWKTYSFCTPDSPFLLWFVCFAVYLNQNNEKIFHNFSIELIYLYLR